MQQHRRRNDVRPVLIGGLGGAIVGLAIWTAADAFVFFPVFLTIGLVVGMATGMTSGS